MYTTDGMSKEDEMGRR